MHASHLLALLTLSHHVLSTPAPAPPGSQGNQSATPTQSRARTIPAIRYNCLGSTDFAAEYLRQNKDEFKGAHFRIGGIDPNRPNGPPSDQPSIPPTSVQMRVPLLAQQHFQKPGVSAETVRPVPALPADVGRHVQRLSQSEFTVFYLLSPAYLAELADALDPTFMLGGMRMGLASSAFAWVKGALVNRLRMKLHLFPSLDAERSFAEERQNVNDSTLNEPPPEDFVALLNDPKLNGDGSLQQIYSYRERLLMYRSTDWRQMLD